MSRKSLFVVQSDSVGKTRQKQPKKCTENMSDTLGVRQCHF